MLESWRRKEQALRHEWDLEAIESSDMEAKNKDAVLECLGRFSEDLAALQRAIRWGDGETLFNEFTRARSIRKAIIDAGQDSGAVNFGRNQRKGDGDEKA